MNRKSTVPVVITKHYNLLLWLMKQVPKFPRSHKFVLGDRIQNHALDILECLLEAAFGDTYGLRLALLGGTVFTHSPRKRVGLA